jgi:hypothetical protein
MQPLGGAAPCRGDLPFQTVVVVHVPLRCTKVVHLWFVLMTVSAVTAASWAQLAVLAYVGGAACSIACMLGVLYLCRKRVECAAWRPPAIGDTPSGTLSICLSQVVDQL